MSEITSLIEKLEGASEGSRELDAEVFCAFNKGWRPGTGIQLGAVIRPGKLGAAGTMRTPEPVTTSLDAALALAERVVGEDQALSLLADVMWDIQTDLSIKNAACLLCAAILRAKTSNPEGEA